MFKQKLKGVTLLEILLVIVIMSAILLVVMQMINQKTNSMKRAMAAQQFQEIAKATMAYYTLEGKWLLPTEFQVARVLQGNLLPGLDVMPSNNPVTYLNPWGTEYFYNINTIPIPDPTNTYNIGSYDTVYIYTTVPGTENAEIIAGMLPLAYTTTQPTNTTSIAPCPPGSLNYCSVVMFVNLPKQDLNNADSVSFAGIYSNGGCVPVPVCPKDTNGNPLTPHIYVVPISASGVYTDPAITNPGCSADANGNPAAGCTTSPLPMTSFSAYATAPNDAPLGCDGSWRVSCVKDNTGSLLSFTTTIPQVTSADPSELQNQYWRVCLSISTNAGSFTPNNAVWSQLSGQVMAVVRCSNDNAPSGSTIRVWKM